MMKIAMAFLAIFMASHISAQNPTILRYKGRQMTCNWKSQFSQISTPCDNRNLMVHVEPEVKEMIRYVDLYIENYYIGRDNTYPYIFKNNYRLHYLPPRPYDMRAVIVDRCGKGHRIWKEIRIVKCGR